MPFEFFKDITDDYPDNDDEIELMFVQMIADDAEQYPEKLIPFTQEMSDELNELFAGIEDKS